MPEHFHLLISEAEAGNPSVVVKVVKERFTRLLNRKRRKSSGAQAALWSPAPRPILAETLLRFQYLEPTQAGGKAALSASQSGEARLGRAAGAVEVEQLPFLCLW
jgi:hypothetical protein